MPANNDTLKLLDCPFCGGEASFGTIEYDDHTVKKQGWSQNIFHTVNCIQCGGGTEKRRRTQEDAAKSWNARSVLPEWRRVETEADFNQPQGLYWTTYIGDDGKLEVGSDRIYLDDQIFEANTVAYMRILEPAPYQPQGEGKDE